MRRHPLHLAGFTLLELLVVIAIVAVATGGISLSLQDTAVGQLDKEGQRLSAMLEVARAQSRRTGTPWVWQTKDNGFVLNREFHPWLNPQTQAQVTQGQGQRMVLGPEPLIEAQTLRLQLQTHQRWISTNGLTPFSLSNTPPNLATTSP